MVGRAMGLSGQDWAANALLVIRLGNGHGDSLGYSVNW